MTRRIKLYEVGPRDGLQNEKEILPTATKVELIDRLSQTGLTYIEATSFVSPKWVPQMGDAAAVMAGISRRAGVTYPVLAPNLKGMEDALAAGVTEVAVFAAASEAFSQKNINCSIVESLERFRSVIHLAREREVSVRGYVSCVVGCPYEGHVDPAQVVRVAAWLMEHGCYEISLGDTIGVGTPKSIVTMLNAVRRDVPVERLALHCHDTYGQALANIYAGLGEGVGVIDSAVAGLGGCPYAKGASGNVATEDVLYLLDGLGFETGVDLDAVIDAAWYVSDRLGRLPQSSLANARGRRDGSRPAPG